jgi:colanic acid biosynthesis glycosyl transferase WcaI
MRFLILSQYFPPEVGASQVRLSSMCRELVRAGHEVDVVTGMPHHPFGKIFAGYRGQFAKRELQGGVRVYRTWLYAAAGSGWRRIVSYFSFVLTALCSIVRVRRPDYIFVDSPPLFLGVTGWLASLYWKCPFIFNVADLWPDSVLDLGVMKEGAFVQAAFRLEKWIYKRARFVTAVTQGIYDVLLNRKKVPAEKILFLPNGVDTGIIQPSSPDEVLKTRLGLTGKRIAIYAGNHGYAAGAEQILYAAKLLETYPDFHFLFLGDGPDKPRLQRLAADLELRNTSFVGSVPLERVSAYLSISEIALVTLRKAGVTRGARSAKTFVMMAAAKPVILAGEGENEELIRASGAGVVVSPHDPQQFASAILAMYENPEASREMGLRGLTYVRENFEWSILVRNWLDQLRLATSPQDTTAAASVPVRDRVPKAYSMNRVNPGHDSQSQAERNGRLQNTVAMSRKVSGATKEPGLG